MRIYKYELHPSIPEVDLPEGAKVLSAGEQGGGIVVWALVDPEAERVPRRISIYGTGHEVPADPGTFVQTVFVGPLVFHVFVDGS